MASGKQTDVRLILGYFERAVEKRLLAERNGGQFITSDPCPLHP